MKAVVEVVESGTFVTVQDHGRPGYRKYGVPLSGALDSVSLSAVNALLGNKPDAAALEVFMRGPTLKVLSGGIRIALIGKIAAEVQTARVRNFHVEAQTTATLFPGDMVQIGRSAGGVSYIGFSGGILVPPVLGSRSTYRRAALGGINGRALAAGDCLPCEPVRGQVLEAANPQPLTHDEGPIRVMLGPQLDYFSEQAITDFLGKPFIVTADMDRMGMRLTGARLMHGDRGQEIVSDGVTPGSIQVPGDGYPIVLLADCQTTGGYPKIATVIKADLPCLAHVMPGMELRFRSVSAREAAAALHARVQQLNAWIAGITHFRPPGLINEEALLGANLISGAVRGDECQY
jgi:biotin-dependent carboxylase-like uncharacterized protein